MFTCLDCGRDFDVPKTIHTEFGYEAVSPCCGADYIDTVICDGCGKPIFSAYIHTVDNRNYCESCYECKDE